MRRRLKRGLLAISRDKPKRIFQDYAAVDDFGERAERKKEAGATARAHGHDLGKWHKRPNDPSGRINSFCVKCNRPVVVFTGDPLDGFPAIYGKAFTEECK
jgi:hypothetical protein